MIELLLLILVIVMVGLNSRTSNRLGALEKELEAIKADLSKRQAATSASTVTAVSAEAAVDAIQDEPVSPIELAAREAHEEASAPAAQPAALAEDVGTGQETVAPGPVPQPAAAQARTRENLESYLGARWPVWVGGVALAFGGIFLVRYSIEAGLLGPAARLTLACLFGLVLLVAGEIVRRRAMPQISERYSHAMIPGALTAAGAVTLLGAIYAAYGIYAFIGPASAFVLLALVSFATIALSLLHGQALAGLGLLASLVTPGLVATEEPNANALFIFLGLTWLAVNAASRFRRWTIVPMLANIGAGLWAVAYVAGSDAFDPVPPSLALIVMIAGTGFFWPGSRYEAGAPAKTGWRGLLFRPPLKITLSIAIMTMLPALVMVITDSATGLDPLFAFAAVTAALAALGASRVWALWPALVSAASAVLGITLTALSWLDYQVIPEATEGQPAATLVPTYGNEVAVSLLTGAIFTLLGFAFLRRFRKPEPEFSIVWAFLMPAVPVALAVISFLNFGDLGRDWTHGLYGLALGLVLLVGAEWLFRQREETAEDGTGPSIDWPANLLVAGSFAGFTLALHALTNGIVTTILVSVLGFAYLLAMRLKPWPALPWMMAAAILIVFGRIAWEPTLIGPNSLGTTPFFNALLPGYGIPTLLAIVSAWLLRDSPDFRVRNLMQALASLAALMTIAVLVRHAMNGGVLDSRVPTLGEQSIYTLVTVGFSGILMTLDLRSPSPVFRFGSMIAGVIATINVLSLHLFALNPYFSGENTGRWPFFNLLLIGYLLPALAYGLVAWYARGRRPQPYVVMLALAGAVLGFLWATLSVRRFWQGENIADWKDFLQGETYTYSVVWLLIGVALLAIGSKLDAKSLRLASAGLVLIAVVKVFLIDMSNLEGILRALSFIGLGAVLIGIGLFYQRILVNRNSPPAPADSPADSQESTS